MEPTTDIPTDERNLMHIQYASLIIDDQILPKSKPIEGKSFQKVKTHIGMIPISLSR